MSLDDGEEATRLHFAARAGDLRGVLALLDSGENPNAFDDLGKTPLHYACEGDHLDVVKMLLARGAHVDARDEARIGNTALAEVAGNCSLEIAQVLVDAGADPTTPGWMQLSALHRAKERKRGDGPAVYALLRAVAENPGRLRRR